jgi:hypothetical protein
MRRSRTVAVPERGHGKVQPRRQTTLSAAPGASGGIGRRAGFRFLCPKGCGGSSPPSPTTLPSGLGSTSVRQARHRSGQGHRASRETRRNQVVTTRRPAPARQSPRSSQRGASSLVTGELASRHVFRLTGVRVPGTVPAVPTDLGQLHRRQASVARLATMGAPSAERGSGPMALGVVRRSAAPPVALPAGAALRSCDDKGRMKPGFARPLAELLGWEEGALACHAEGPWLVLTQPEALRGAKRIRNSTRAHLSCSGTERLCLPPPRRTRSSAPRARCSWSPCPTRKEPS